MVSTLASLLFLGIVPAANADTPPPRTLPGIEVMAVAATSDVPAQFVLPAVSASGLLLVDLESGEEIASVNPDRKRPMASLTKIMTALLVLEDDNLYSTVTIPPISEGIGGSAIGLRSGEHLSTSSLLRALLIQSANDAAYALAVTTEGNVGAFVRRMNARATALGLASTAFANPAGLDHPEQYSSPRDLFWLTKAALRYPEFRSIVDTRLAVIRSNEGREYGLRNTNEMLPFNPLVHGVKTGTTTNAGECLIVLFEESGREYLLVLLHSKDRYTDALLVLEAMHAAAQKS